MRAINIILIGFIMLLLPSCYSGLNIPKEERNLELMKSPEAINGIYSNNPVDSLKGEQNPFWTHFKPFFKNKITDQFQNENPDLKVEIKIKENRKIKISLIQKEEIIDSKYFNYDIIDNQIRIKKNWTRKGVPLLFYQHHREVIILSRNKELDLIATFEGSYSGGILIIIFGGSIKNKSVYKRI